MEKIGRDFLIGFLLLLIAVGIGYAIGKAPGACSVTAERLELRTDRP